MVRLSAKNSRVQKLAKIVVDCGTAKKLTEIRKIKVSGFTTVSGKGSIDATDAWSFNICNVIPGTRPIAKLSICSRNGPIAATCKAVKCFQINSTLRRRA